MTKETTFFTTPNGDFYSIDLTERNHSVVCVIPTITLAKAQISPELFQNTIKHIISLNRDYIEKVYFENVRIHYKFLSFQLFGHIRGALKTELRRPVKYSELLSGKEDYKWIEEGFLPKFPEDLEQDLQYLDKRIRNMYWAFKKGKVKGIPYILPEDYDIVYNYFYDLDPIEIKPVFDVYVKTTTPSTTGDPDKVSEMLLGKFQSLDVKLKIL